MMKLALLVCMFMYFCMTYSHSLNREYDEQWDEFKMSRNRRFESRHEEVIRKNIFVKNAKMIDRHNLEYERGLQSYTMKMNKFGDWTEEELSGLHGAKLSPNVRSERSSSFLNPLSIRELPDKVDWRDHNLVAPVENQGKCGSCYAFSSVGALEGQMARKTGKLVRLSKQNVVDCSIGYWPNSGCEGGLMNSTYDFILDQNGLDTAEAYPYDSINVSKECRFKKDKVAARITGYVELERGNEQQLLEAVATVGPIAVAIDAGHYSFKFYHKGVYREPSCTTILNHAVLVVGYGTENGLDYWLIKNSWGTFIQDEGYIKLLRNENHCGVAEAGIYPTV